MCGSVTTEDAENRALSLFVVGARPLFLKQLEVKLCSFRLRLLLLRSSCTRQFATVDYALSAPHNGPTFANNFQKSRNETQEEQH